MDKGLWKSEAAVSVVTRPTNAPWPTVFAIAMVLDFPQAYVQP